MGVGAIGFVVDAALLTVLVSGFAWGLYAARAVSFSCAVTVTWICNRNWVFERTADISREYTQYLSMQIVGATLNLGTYVALLELFPALGRWPVVPLAIGGIIALIFNFNVAKHFVFASAGRPPAGGRPDSGGATYSGRENLEAMAGARNYNAHLLRLVEQEAAAGPVLDFGAGAGTFARPMRDAGYALTCVEPDAELRGALAALNLKAVESLEAVPDASVSYVYTLNVLEHVEDDVAALEQLRRCLVPGGKLLIYVPAFELLYSAMDAKVGHFRRYRRRTLTAKLEAAGFEVRAARYVDSLGFVATLLYKLLGNRSGVIGGASVRLYDRWVFPLSRALDRILGPVAGKNLLVTATAGAVADRA